MDLGLDGRACVVTGASRGIGHAVARRLAEEGARVLMVARSQDALADAAATVPGAAWLAADVTDPDAARRIVDAASERLGGLDVLVNNAGTSENIALTDLTDDDWRAQHELHVLAPVRLMGLAAPLMARRGWGRIVNVTSSSGKRPSQSNVAYSVAKAGQLSASRAFADAYAADGVLINAVAPGPTATGLWTGDGGLADQVAQASGTTREEALAAAARRIPRGRLGAVAGAAWSADGGSVNIII